MIIGTAGHIDHGKTVLIKALTGVNTDRLVEEQRRGISIDLGFAEFILPSGRHAGVVDVPGHEAFIKNMLAGATGFDVALIVVAADDGVMPQTREHLDIINLLGVGKAIVAITKVDLVDADMVALVTEDVESLLKDTPLQGSPVIPVSAVAGEGLDRLLKTLDEAAGSLKEKTGGRPFRLPIDRVFSLKGTGTVVTGTLWSGSIHSEDSAEILPAGLPVRIRSVQVHNKKLNEAKAGNRVAVNLPGVEKNALNRGNVLARAGAYRPSYMFDAELTLLKGAPAPLKQWTRVRVHHGTAEVMGRVVLIDKESLESGGRAYAQFRLERPVVAYRGDRFIVRSYSPMTTIGGGVVLLGQARRRKRFDVDTIELLDAVYAGDMVAAIRLALDKRGTFIETVELARLLDLSSEELGAAVDILISDNLVVSVAGEKKYVVSTASLLLLEDKIVEVARGYAAANPLEAGIGREALKAKALRRVDNKAAGLILGEMVKKEQLVMRGDAFIDAEQAGTGGTRQDKMADDFAALFEQAGLAPPRLSELAEEFRLTAKEAQTVLAALKKDGRVVQIADGIILASSAVDSAETTARELIKEQGRMTVSEFKNKIRTSRKFAVPILEYFDRKKVTKREDDYRVLA